MPLVMCDGKRHPGHRSPFWGRLDLPGLTRNQPPKRSSPTFQKLREVRVAGKFPVSIRILHDVHFSVRADGGEVEVGESLTRLAAHYDKTAGGASITCPGD